MTGKVIEMPARKSDPNVVRIVQFRIGGREYELNRNRLSRQIVFTAIPDS